MTIWDYKPAQSQCNVDLSINIKINLNSTKALKQNFKCNSKYDVLNEMSEQYIFRWAVRNILCALCYNNDSKPHNV
jgi:hypothetical protein